MSFVVRRAAVFALPLLILPIAAHATPKVGTVTNSNSAVVAHNGAVVPATPNMPLFEGDKVITRAGGSANVALPDHSVHLGSSSMIPMDNNPSVLSLDPKSSRGGDARGQTLQQLAKLDHEDHFGDDHGNHLGRCHTKHDDGDDDDDDNDHDRHDDHGHHFHHGHNPHCPVSP